MSRDDLRAPAGREGERAAVPGDVRSSRMEKRMHSSPATQRSSSCVTRVMCSRGRPSGTLVTTRMCWLLWMTGVAVAVVLSVSVVFMAVQFRPSAPPAHPKRSQLQPMAQGLHLSIRNEEERLS